MKLFILAILVLMLYTLNYSFEDQNIEAKQISNVNIINDIGFTYGKAPLIKVVDLPIIKDLSEIKANLKKETKNIPILTFKKQNKVYDQVNYEQTKIEAYQASSSNLKVLLGFEGIRYGWNGNYYNDYATPDVQIAVSKDHVVEFVNVLGAVWTKTGSFVSYINLYSLFGGEFIFYPRLIYDESSGRFFASVLDVDLNTLKGSIRIAVSATSNPLGTWYVYVFPQPNNYFIYDPYLGVNNDKVVVSGNVFDLWAFEYKGAQYWVINKQQLLTGSPSVNYVVSSLDNKVASIRPAIHLSSTNTFYMATTLILNYDNRVYVYSITGIPPSITVKKYDFSVKTLTYPPDAPQLGSTYYLFTADYRIQDIIWKNGRLIFTANVGCKPDGDTTTRSCLRIIEIDTDKLQLKQDFNYGKSGKYFFYGSLRLNTDDILFIVFGYSSSSDYPGIMASYQTTPNSLKEPIIVKAGTGPETTFCFLDICFYGEYFGSSTDPSEPQNVWIAGEFGRGASGWSTYIAKVGLPYTYIFASYSIIGDEAGSSPPTLKYYFDKTLQTVTLTKTSTKYLVDINSPWEVPETLPGSTANIRWKTEQVTSGTVTEPLTLSFTYYHQYLITFKYQVIGSAGYGEPTISFVQFGKNVTTEPNKSVWADSNTEYVYQNPLPNSDENERWYSPNNKGKVSKPGVVLVTYYHQYYVQFKYTIINGGEGYSPPSIKIFQFGEIVTVEPNVYVWADENEYNATNPLAGSNENERWYSLNSQGRINKAGIYEIVYYHQYNVQFNYRIIGKWNPNAPEVTYVQFGKQLTNNLNITAWVDANTNFNIMPNPLTGSTNNERWYTTNSTSGIVDKWKSILIIYYHQYYVILDVNAKDGGTVSPSSGWYNSGTTLTISATPNEGWKFYKWEGVGAGSYTGSEIGAKITVNSPIIQKAIFLVSLKIYSSSEGSVKYIYEGEEGKVEGDSMKEIFVLPGTEVTLIAEPSSIFYVFKSWNIEAKDSQIKIKVNKPTEIIATFDLNWLFIIGITIPVVAGIGVTLFILMKRRKALVQPSMPSITPLATNYCPSCGSPISPEDVFCGRCGRKLK
jgi:hypothetical protein